MDLIQVFQNDKSATVSASVGSIGATVIKAKRGGDKPVRFEKKQTSRILNYFGIPDTGSEGIDDIITYNNSYPIYVSAPSSNGKYGGVLVTTNGVEQFIGGKTSKTIDFSNVDNSEVVLEKSDPSVSEITKIILDFANYKNQSIDILVNGVSIDVSASDAEPEILTSTVGTGTFTRETGVLAFDFTTVPTADSKIEVVYKTDRSSDVYFALINANPQEDDLKVKVTTNDQFNFIVDVMKKRYDNKTIYSRLSGFPKEIAIVEETKNGYGENIFAETVFNENDDFLQAIVNKEISFSIFTNSEDYDEFSGGVRGKTETTDLARGWDFFKETKYKSNIFFDTTADSTIPGIFLTLRQSYQKRAYFIFPCPNVSYDSAITTMQPLMTDEKGLACYWGYGKIINQYTGKTMASSLMGRRALRLADMWDVFNGLAPAYYNENGKYGGQLGSGILEMFYEVNEDQEQLLEDARINPTVNHPVFGFTITRERTTQSMQSDYASIGHTRLADYLIDNIINKVLPYQLFKLNDTDHRARVKSQIDTIISPITANPFNLLSDFIVKCDEENNNAEVLSREEFVVSVAIKFTPFGKWIKLFFTNTAQGVSVESEV